MHATRHRNFQRRKQCSLTPILGVRIQNLPLPRTFSPSPCGFPSAASSPPPITASLWVPGRISARNCCSQLSASPGFCSLCPGSAASACASDSPVSLPHPATAVARPLAQSLEVGGLSGHAWGSPAKSAGIAGFSLHTGDAWTVRTVAGGRLCVARRSGTAPLSGRGWGRGRGLCKRRTGAEVG